MVNSTVEVASSMRIRLTGSAAALSRVSADGDAVLPKPQEMQVSDRIRVDRMSLVYVFFHGIAFLSVLFLVIKFPVIGSILWGVFPCNKTITEQNNSVNKLFFKDIPLFPHII